MRFQIQLNVMTYILAVREYDLRQKNEKLK